MSEEEIRVKVAELCGWEFPPEFSNAFGMGFFCEEESMRECPNYPRDLNACAEMEGTLGKKYGQFHDELLNITPTPEVMSSSALQRCLAFLAVHGIDASLSK